MAQPRQQPQPQPQPQKAFPVSWDQFHRDARALQQRVSREAARLTGVDLVIPAA